VTGWTADELEKIGTADELEIASLRSDGTLGSKRTIWVVRVDDDLYVRSVNGRTSDWFRGTQRRHQGRIRAGGVQGRHVRRGRGRPGGSDRRGVPAEVPAVRQA